MMVMVKMVIGNGDDMVITVVGGVMVDHDE